MRAILALLLTSTLLNAQVFTVADNNPASLANAITLANNYNGAASINFAAGLNITLANELPILTNPAGIVINGNFSTISGGSTSATTGNRVFFMGVSAGESAVTTGFGSLVATPNASWAINNLTIQNGNARGGNGGSAAGGGAGLGGGIFVNAGTLTVTNVNFAANRATGGNGGAGGDDGGGGGMGGNGGSGTGYNAGGGGFGIGANGGDGGTLSNLSPGLAGRFSGGAPGGEGYNLAVPTSGGANGGGGGGGPPIPATGYGGSGGVGGSSTIGGFGGGGGSGRPGGYGGGAGSNHTSFNGPTGGFAGGGAGGSPGGGAGGFAAGNGQNVFGGGGGGGAGLGGAIFVRQGALLQFFDGGLGGNFAQGGSGGQNGQGLGSGFFLAGSGSYTVSIHNTITISDSIGGGLDSQISGGFAKYGAGTLILAGGNTYTGGTTVSAGTLALSHDFVSDGAPALNPNAGTVNVNANAILRFDTSNNLGGNTATAAPAVVVNFGTVTNSGNYYNLFQNLTLVGATLTGVGGFGQGYGSYAVRNTLTSYSVSQITLTGTNAALNLSPAGTTTFDVLGSDLTVNANIANNPAAAGTLLKTGPGTMTLLGAGTYTGATTVNAGTLALNRDGAVTAPAIANGTITIASAATLRFDSNNALGYQTATGANVVVNGGVVTNSGGWYNQIQNLTLNGATLTGVGGFPDYGSFAIRNTLTSSGTSQIVLGTANNGALALSPAGTTTFNVQSGTLTVNALMKDNAGFGQGAISGAVVKTGAGIMLLTGNNTYSGGTTVTDGTLAIASNACLGVAGTGVSVSNATLRTDAAMTLDRPITIAPNTTANFNTNGFAATVSGVVSGNGGFVKQGNGTLTLTSLANGQATSRIDGGTLAVSNDRQLGTDGGMLSMNGGTLRTIASFASGRVMQISAGKTAVIEIPTNVSTTWNGYVNQEFNTLPPGNLALQGGGTLVINSDNLSLYSYTGTTNVYAGTLRGTGRLASRIIVAAGATLHPGDGATGNLTILSGPIYNGSIVGGLDFASGSRFGVSITAPGANTKLINYPNPNGSVAPTGLGGINLVVDLTATPLSVGQHYNFTIATGMGDQGLLSITDPSRFTFVNAGDYSIGSPTLTGTSTGDLVLGFTAVPVPEPALLGVALLAVAAWRRPSRS